MAAPDTLAHRLEQEAAIEAAETSAPDTLTPTGSDSKFMSGGRSVGGLSGTSTEPPATGSEAQIRHNSIEEALKPLTTDARPTLAAGQDHKSVQSVSQLHVPGEFPKGTVR